jgi:hypothetical protein
VTRALQSPRACVRNSIVARIAGRVFLLHHRCCKKTRACDRAGERRAAGKRIER